MLLTITNHTPPATDLGFLLHKHPERLHRFGVSFGEAFVFFSAATDDAATICLLVDVDPLALVRGRGDLGHSDAPYVNDRGYAASSLLVSALQKAFGTALSGRCKERPELVERELDLSIELPAMPLRGDRRLLHRLFDPLMYDIQISAPSPGSAATGTGSHERVVLHTRATIQDVLSHLTILIPVLDHQTHRWVGEGDGELLLRRGASWLRGHPEAGLIVRRALKHQKHLIKKVLSQYPELAESGATTAGPWDSEMIEVMSARPLSLNAQRFARIEEVLVGVGAADQAKVTSVIDLGCGDGSLLQVLAAHPQFKRLAGMDVATEAVGHAVKRLQGDDGAARQHCPVDIMQGSLMYRDPRIYGFDAALLIEVLEHIEEDRLATLQRHVFGDGGYKLIVVTTPNAEFNALYLGMRDGQRRHSDHRFEWTRSEFAAWVSQVSATYGYEADIMPIGHVDPEKGASTQMAVFRRSSQLRGLEGGT